MTKDWTGYPFGGYDGSDESFEKLQGMVPHPQDVEPTARQSEAAPDTWVVPPAVVCGDCGGALRPEREVVSWSEDGGTALSWDVRKVHADDGSPQCLGRRDAVRRKPGYFACMECGQPPDEPHGKKCSDPSGRSGGRVADGP